MNSKNKAVFNWSGGKDSALALQKILQENEFEVIALLTTINEETHTSSIHSIPLELLRRQAESIGIPLCTVFFARDLSNYDSKMLKTVEDFKKQGVTHFIFGDIFLADVKTCRESKLNPLGIEVVEPLWNRSSASIIAEFINSGIKSKIIVTQSDKLDITFIGKDINQHTVDSFCNDIDPCGENGEYHTFSYSGGLFKSEIDFLISKIDKVSYDIKLDNGQTKTFEYWQAVITT